MEDCSRAGRRGRPIQVCESRADVDRKGAARKDGRGWMDGG